MSDRWDVPTSSGGARKVKIGDKISLPPPVPWFTTAINTAGMKRYLVFFYAFYYPFGRLE